MRRLRAALLLAAAALLAACSVPDPRQAEHLDDIPATQISAIDALPEILPTKLASVRYEAVAEVAGVSCRRQAYKGTPPSWEDALRRTKYRAMQAGGNAIANLNCEAPQKNSLTTVCFESIRCTAKAIRLLN
jgi:hypothetical protein